MAKKSYSKSKIMRDHEIHIEALKVLQGPHGFDAMLFIGAAGSYGAAWVLQMLSGQMKKPDNLTSEEFSKMSYWERVQAAIASTPSLKEQAVSSVTYPVDYAFGSSSGSFNPSDMFKMATTAPATFGHLCITLLLMRAVFGTGGAAEILKGIGEIVPL